MVRYLDIIKEYGELTAVTILDGKQKKTITYKQHLHDIKVCAKCLENILGDIEGIPIGVLAKSGYESAVLISAIIFSRAVAVLINPYETHDKISNQIKMAKIGALVLDEGFNTDENLHVSTIRINELFNGETEEKELYDFSDDERNALSVIMFTSGTTGASKGVKLHIGSVFYKKRRISTNWEREQGKDNCIGMKTYINFPFFHVAGLTYWLLWTTCGCEMFLSKNPQNIISDLSNVEIDAACVVPSTLKLWQKALDRGKNNRLGNVREIFTGGAKVSAQECIDYKEQGISIVQSYGMTESGGGATINYDVLNHPDSIGKAMDYCEVLIVDGEICIKHHALMLGYLDDELATKEVLKDGILYTGDLGYMDDDGYVYITGRKKNLIITSNGENVSPEELETKLYQNEHVSECKVFQKDDRIAAMINADIQYHDEIKSYIINLNKTLPGFKKIYNVEFCNGEIEKTANGKLKR